MEIVARIQLDRPYYEQFYAAWYRHRSKWQRFVLPMTIMLLITGTACLFLRPRDLVPGLALLACGVYYGIQIATHKSKWISGRVADLPSEISAEIIFHDNHVETKTQYSESKLKFELIRDVTLTDDGFFVVFPNKHSMYVPRASIESADEYSMLALKLGKFAKTDT